MLHSGIGNAIIVKLFDLTRALPQRIESQFRTHWSFVPASWNSYFRHKLKLGCSLELRRYMSDHVDCENGKLMCLWLHATCTKNWKQVHTINMENASASMVPSQS